MQQFRRFVRGPVGKLLLAAIILPFVISGFYGYFASSGSQGAVAEVAGNKITRAYVNSRTERLRQMVRQESPNASEKMIDSVIRPDMVLQGIINEQLVAAAAKNDNMAFSDAQAAQLIRANPAFQENGQFSQQRFQDLLANQGMSPRGYMNGLRQDHLSQQYRTGIRATGFALPGEFADQVRLQAQTRDIRYATLNVKTLRAGEKVTGQQVQTYYKNHQGDFMRPEQYKVRYLELSPADFKDKVKITDAQIQQEYKARKAMRESKSTRRDVADILIAVNGKRTEKQAIARAEQARKELENGKSFAAVAKKYSDDASTANNGGDLGMLDKGALPDKLEATLNKLKVGQVSQPVVAKSGVHLLKILKEESQTMPPLKQMRGQIESDLRSAKVDSLISQDASKLEDLVYEHDDLAQPARQVGLTVKTSDWAALDNLPAPLSNAKVRKALQSDAVAQQGHNSDLLQVGKNHYLVVHLAGTKPATPKPLSEVSDDIRGTLKTQAALKRIKDLGEQARAAVNKDGAGLEKVARLMNTDIQTKKNLSRGASDPAQQLVDAAFSAPHPQDGKPSPVQFVTLGDGSLAAFQVTKVTDGSVKGMSKDDKDKALQQLAQAEGQESYQDVMAYLRNTLVGAIAGGLSSVRWSGQRYASPGSSKGMETVAAPAST